jgi:uncharacterized protein (DUF433 family)
MPFAGEAGEPAGDRTQGGWYNAVDGGHREAAMVEDRVTIEAGKMGGVPCIRGLRVPVATVVAMIAEGMTREEILDAYPDLEAEDITAALKYAAAVVSGVSAEPVLAG